MLCVHHVINETNKNRANALRMTEKDLNISAYCKAEATERRGHWAARRTRRTDGKKRKVRHRQNDEKTQ